MTPLSITALISLGGQSEKVRRRISRLPQVALHVALLHVPTP
jgi:hypothetical protein